MDDALLTRACTSTPQQAGAHFSFVARARFRHAIAKWHRSRWARRVSGKGLARLVIVAVTTDIATVLTPIPSCGCPIGNVLGTDHGATNLLKPASRR
jgi:hypothetical protein